MFWRRYCSVRGFMQALLDGFVFFGLSRLWFGLGV